MTAEAMTADIAAAPAKRYKARKGREEVPPPIAAFIASVVAAGTSPPALETALFGFKWCFDDKGDFYHWVELFNFFDEVFMEHVAKRADLRCEADASNDAAPPPTLPSAMLTAVCRALSAILDNCANRHLFVSSDYLSLLLGADDRELVAVVLETLMVLSRRPMEGTRQMSRWRPGQDLFKRLVAMTKGWGGKQQGLDMLACVAEGGLPEPLPEGPRSLRFQYYGAGTAAHGSAGNEGARGDEKLRVVQVAPYRLQSSTWRELAREHGVPADLMFSFGAAYHNARSFASLSARRRRVQERLQVYSVLLYCWVDASVVQFLQNSEPELASELTAVACMHGSGPDTQRLRSLGLGALAAFASDRSRTGATLAALGAGDTSSAGRGVLPHILQALKSGAEVASPGPSRSDSGESDPKRPRLAEPDTTEAYAEAALALVYSLMLTSHGLHALSGAGLVPALVPMLSDTSSAREGLVTAAVRSLESFIDFLPTSAQLFRELMGLDKAIKRIVLEIESADPGALAHPPQQCENVPAAPTAQVDGSQALRETTEGAEAAPAAGTLGYNKKRLLKALLRTVTVASYSPGASTRAVLENTRLPSCLTALLLRPRRFGGGIFSLAANMMSDILHQEPTCFGVLDAWGTPAALLKMVVQRGGLPVSAETLCCVPTSIVAICLNQAGLEAVRRSRALDSIVRMFTSPSYVKALAGDTASVLGSGLDELMRHAPDLRAEGVRATIDILRALAKAHEKVVEKLAAEERSETPVPCPAPGALPMVTDAGAVANPVAATDVVEEDSLRSGATGAIYAEAEAGAMALSETMLSDAVSNAVRLLESTLGSKDTSKEFVQQGGVQLLLQLYALPAMTSSNTPISATMAITFRSFGADNAGPVAKAVCDRTYFALKRASAELELLPWEGIAEGGKDGNTNLGGAPDKDTTGLEADVSEGGLPPALVRALRESECLLSLAAGHVRGSTAFQKELSKEHGLVFIEALGHVMCTTLWQSAARTRASIAQKGPEPNTSAHGAPGGSSGGAQSTEEDSGAPEGASGQNAAGTGDAGSAHPSEGRAGNAADAVRGKKTRPGTIATFTSAARGFLQAIVKAASSTSRREQFSPAVLHRTCAGVARTLTSTLLYKGPLAISDLSLGSPSAAEHELASRKAIVDGIRREYVAAAAENADALLFDARRSTANAFLHGSLQENAVLEALRSVTLWATEEHVSVMSKKSEESEVQDPVLGADIEASSKAACYCLALFERLARAQLVLTGATATNNFIAARYRNVPGTPPPAAGQMTMFEIQSEAMGIATALWSREDFFSGIFDDAVVSAVLSLMSAATVASICEMGFSEARARHALRQVGSDSLDLALEWIFSHPNVEPPPEPEVPSGADPAGAASDAAAAGASGADTDAGASGEASGVGAPNGGADGAVPAPSQVGIAPTTATQTGRITAEDLQRAVMAGQAAGAASAAGGASGGQDDGGHPGPNVKEAPKLPSVDYVVAKCCNLLKRTGGVLPAAMKLLSRSITGAPEYDMSPGRAKEVQAAARARADVVVGGLVGAISREVLSYKEDQRLLHCVLLLVDGKQNSSSARAAAASTPRAIEIALKVLADIDEDAGEAQQQLLATAALLLAAFSRITTTKPSASSGIGASGGAGAGDAKVSGLVPAATSGEGGDNTSPDDEREKAMKVLVEAAATTSPQGVPALGEGARGQALAACLQRLTAERPPSSSVLQALCSLLGPITRDNAVAVSLFRGGGVRALLRMPAASTFPGYDAWLRVILRHCLEDPVSLRQAMEAEIRSYVGMAVQRQQGVPLRAVLSSCTALIERDPSAFASALAAVCDLKTEPSGRCTVVLHVRDRESRDKTPHDTPAKPAKREDVQQSKPRESIARALESGSASAMDVDRGEEEAGAADESLKELKEAEKHAAHRALFALGAIADFSMLFPSTFAPAVSRIERDPQHGIPFKKESEKERERTKGKGKEKALDANATESTSLLSLLFNVLLPSALGERRGDAAIRQAIANRAGTALVAVSLMSAEGRRRVLRSISDKLSSPLEAPADERMKLAVTCRPTLDLITAMVTTGSNGGVVSADNIKAITDARVAEALGTVLQAVDLHHPQAPALVSAILKPLDALARAALAAANKADPCGRAAGARRDAGRALESTAADLERIRANINALGSTVAELTGGRPGSAARAGAEGGVGDPLAVGRDPAADTADDGEGRAAGSTAPRGRGGEGRAGGNGDAEPLDELAVAMNEGTALTDLAAAMQETAQATYSDGYGPSGLGGAGPGQAEADEGIEEDYDDDDGMGEEIDFPDEDLEQQMGGGMTGGWHILGDDDGSGNPPTGVQGDLPLMDGVHGLPPGATMSIRDAPDGQSHRVIELRLPQGFAGLLDGAEREGLSFGQSFFETVTAQARAALDSFDTIAGQSRENTGGGSARDRDVLSAPHPLLQDQPAEGAGGARPADAATGSVPFGGLRQARHGGLAAPRFHRARPLDDETGQAIRRRAGAQGVRLFDFSDDQVSATGPAESLLNAGGAPGQYVVVQEGMAPSSARVVMVGGPQGPAGSGGRNDGRLAHVGRDTATIPPPLMIESAHAISRAAAESRATRWRGQLPAARADQTSAGPPLHGMPTGGMPEDVVMRFMRASGSVVEDTAPAPGVAAAAAAAIAEAAPVPELWPASGTAHGVVAAGDDGIAPMRAEADNPPAERAQTTTDPRTTSDADGGPDGTQEASLRPAEPSAQPQPPSESQQEPLAEAEEEMVDGDGADEENEDAAGGPADGARASAEAGGDMPAQDAQVRVPGLAEAARCDADGAAEETRADEVSGDGVPAEEPAGEPVGDSAGVPAGAPAGEATAEPAGAPDGAEGSEMPGGVDPSFLEALPPELRAEVMATQVPQIEREHQRRRAASNDAGRGSQPAARDAPEGGTSGAGTDLDPEFLSALPPELQAEVMAQSRAAARAPPSRPAQPDNASIVASFPRELREEVFLTADDSFIASLPPSLRAEAEAARRRAAEAAARRNQAAPPATHEGLGRGRWRAPMPGGVRGTSSLVPGPPGLATGSDPRRGNSTAGEGVLTETMPVLLGENALASVLSLLRMATPLPGGKTQLQRLLLYLSSNAEVAKQIVWKLALMFRPELTAPVGASEAERAVIEAASAAFDAVRLPSDPVSKKAAATGMFGSNSMIAAAVDESGSPTSVPPVVTRRALETAAYLCKGSDTVGELCIAPLPASEEVARVSKGKGKADEAGASEQKSPSALGLMLKVLGVPVYTRSSAQLESALAFLEQVLKVADRDAMRRSESRFAKVQAAAERVSLEAHRAALRAALARDAGPAGQSTEAVEAAARSAQDGTPGASGGGSGTQASAADELKGLTGPADEILPGVGETDLRRVPALLAVPGLTDLAYAKVADVMKLLTACHAPSLELFITELGAAASDMHEDVAAELQRVASRAEAAGDASGTGAVGGAGAGLLRVLQAMRMLTTRADAVEASRARLQKALAKARAARGVSEPPGDDDLAGLAPGGAQKRRKLVQDVARSLEPALAKLSVAASAVEAAMGVRKDKTPGRPKAAGAPPSPATLPPAANDLLPFIQSFFALCEAAGLLPPKPDADTERERKPHGAFASGATRGAAGRNEEIEPSSVMMIRTTSLGAAQMAVRAAMAERDGTPLTPAGAGSSRGKERDEGRLVFSFDSNDEGGAFVKFCETHRTLINAYVRQAKALEGPLEPLARVPRLLDFDNKRAFFRHRVRQHAAGERGGTLRVNVRRAFVLEDSFHQLRMRTPAEMRGKLQVQFAGEEGIDAGGLTREWFGCLCKEIFKANYALFSSSSAAGTTFQPNPLSYVNSEHLSYFKFVGRIVGKAIYDGHLMDAHFTRSFYKHMLGMPMTFHDVEAVDPAFYKTLVWMLDNDITDVLDLTFTAEADEFAKHLF
eukprot:PRCOL_00003905-RA